MQLDPYALLSHPLIQQGQPEKDLRNSLCNQIFIFPRAERHIAYKEGLP